MTKKKIVVIGGGWAGCAAALTAEKAGADVTLLERTDMLLGTGLVGGIFRNNGRYTAAEECIAMGAGDLFTVMEAVATHKNMDFPGHKHATLYNIYKIEPAVKKLLLSRGIKLLMADPAVKTEYEGDTITAVITKSGLRLTADAFVDVSGSSAMPLNCNKHGNGCAMCILRCHSFGPRVSVTTQSGVKEWTAEKPTGLGAMSGSCKLFKESLTPEIVTELEKTGCCVVPIPEAIKKHKEKLAMKACQQYALDAYADNIVLLDTGSAKLMTPYYPLEELRMIPGFERARFEDPLSGGKGNSMRYFNFAHVDASLKADGKTNLFCGGERAGAMVGHTEAIVSGSLAGHNAARAANGLEPVILPETTAIGEFIGYVVKQMLDAETRNKKYTFSGSVYFERMQAKNLYSTDDDAIKARVEAAGCTNIFSNL